MVKGMGKGMAEGSYKSGHQAGGDDAVVPLQVGSFRVFTDL